MNSTTAALIIGIVAVLALGAMLWIIARAMPHGGEGGVEGKGPFWRLKAWFRKSPPPPPPATPAPPPAPGSIRADGLKGRNVRLKATGGGVDIKKATATDDLDISASATAQEDASSKKA